VGGGIKVHSTLRPLKWPIVSAPGDYDNGEIGGMIGRGNRSTRRKPAPVPLCPPQIPHAARMRTRAAEAMELCSPTKRIVPDYRHQLCNTLHDENAISRLETSLTAAVNMFII
jgi:hypothetical protein